VAGVADVLRAREIPVFGPSRAAARLEGSKAFSKEVMAAAGVPTARAFVCTTPEETAAALDELGAPYVVKDDGLAAGKGVVVTTSREEALTHAAGCERVVVEEYLDGPEVSLFVVCDGTTVRPLQPAQDFKRIFDGDRGGNTGGMGAYTPLPWAPAALTDEVVATVVRPTLQELAGRGTPFSGLLYVGLALTSKGTRVVEFNVRFGDPETQPLLALLESPLSALLYAAATGTLDQAPEPLFADGAAVAVVMASAGYPESSSKGDVITGVDDAEQVAGVQVIQAGTATVDGDLVTAGGRVLAVVGTGADLEAARRAAYDGVARISFAGAQHRTDIAAKAVAPA
jgi:phosphoribosylamine--glycine ligase